MRALRTASLALGLVVSVASIAPAAAEEAPFLA
jgi:hypothetical protein